ncbi:uncharacterized protein METZ01_LOCUS172664, partial [marine metagenome]
KCVPSSKKKWKKLCLLKFLWWSILVGEITGMMLI